MRINRSVKSGDINKNETLVAACENAKATTGESTLTITTNYPDIQDVSTTWVSYPTAECTRTLTT